MGKFFFSVSFLTLVFLFAATKKAHAYLDPGTGSYLIQILLAGVFGGLYLFKGSLRRVGESIIKIIKLIRKILAGKKQDKNDSEK